MNRDAVIGCILGTAVGDALGLPYEGLSPRRALRLLGPPNRHRLFFGRGMVSDDTEHTCMVAQSLIEAGDDVDLFASRFASRLRWWTLALPAGVGKATARAGFRLWLGVKPGSAGVFSAGNGPTMRAAILGVAIDDVSRMLKFVRTSSRLTHSDPKAEFGAIAVALAARHSGNLDSVDADLWLSDVIDAVGADGAELTALLRRSTESVMLGESTVSFAASLGLDGGVTGYTYHTVPVAIHTWLSHPNDYRQAITTIIRCGGDADTTAAIVGGIVGAGVGETGIPTQWIDNIWETPRSIGWMRTLGQTLTDAMEQERPGKAPTINPIAVLLRNLVFLLVVLIHGFRRLAPPY